MSWAFLSAVASTSDFSRRNFRPLAFAFSASVPADCRKLLYACFLLDVVVVPRLRSDLEDDSVAVLTAVERGAIERAIEVDEGADRVRTIRGDPREAMQQLFFTGRGHLVNRSLIVLAA